MIKPPSAASSQSSSTSDARPIHPLVLPVYPPRALAAKAGLAIVGARVTVDTNGRVIDIRPSLLAPTITPPGYADDFSAAVEAAVRQWQFEPARLEKIETVTTDGRSYQRWAGSENVEAEFDLSFTFTAAGRVEQASAGK